MEFILSDDGAQILGTGRSGNWQTLEEADPRVVAYRLRESAEQTKAEIFQLEASITNRRLREAILGTDGGWLKNINDQIATLRSIIK